MGSLTNFLANRKTPGLHLDQLNLFEERPVPTGLALLVPVDQLDEDPDNPRKEFPPEAIEELAQNIAQRGILQPIVVSDRDDKGRYLIRFGSRRCRAAIQAGLTTVPVVFAVEARNVYDQVAENLKRQNLSPLELAQFIRRLADGVAPRAVPGRHLVVAQPPDRAAVRHARQERGLPRPHRVSRLRDQRRALSLAIAEQRRPGHAWRSALSRKRDQRMAVSDLRETAQGRGLPRLRPGLAGVGRGRAADEHCLEVTDTAAGAAVPRVQSAARGVVSGRVLPSHDLHRNMYDEHDLIDSPLNQTYTADGRSVEIHIYRMPHTGWTLEVVDDLDNSTVWDGEFATDQEALDTAMAEINAEGIAAFITRSPDQPTH